MNESVEKEESQLSTSGLNKDPTVIEELDPNQVKELEESIEAKTQKLNLSRRLGKKIVRNIITSEVTSTLLKVARGEADPSELPEEKLTRSRTKINILLKPVDVATLGNRAPNFLFAESFGNEEDDPDFVEGEEEEGSDSSSEGSDESLSDEENDEKERRKEAAEELVDLHQTDMDNFFDEQWNALWNSQGQDINLNSAAVHDPLEETKNELYRGWWLNGSIWDDENDPDYVYEGEVEQQEEEQDNWETYTRKTAIPKREVTYLVKDAFDLEVEGQLVKEFDEPKSKSVRFHWTPKTNVVPDDGSADLMKEGPKIFNPEELEQLKSQLEQHTQLLLQTYALVFHDESFYLVGHEYRRMFAELCTFSNASQGESLFNISNLSEAYYTLSEIESYPKTDSCQIKWLNSTTGKGYFPRPEACLALMRSNALIFPELVPTVQPHRKKELTNNWTSSEDNILLLGLLQFGHIPNNTTTFWDGRYHNIQKHLLPTRTEKQIRDRLAQFRRTSGTNEVHKCIIEAEKGYPIVCFEKKFPTRLPQTTMDKWEDKYKPAWFSPFNKEFIITSDNRILNGCPIKYLLSVSSNITSKMFQDELLKNNIIINPKTMAVEYCGSEGKSQKMPIVLLPAQQQMIQAASNLLKQLHQSDKEEIKKSAEIQGSDFFDDIEGPVDCRKPFIGIEISRCSDKNKSPLSESEELKDKEVQQHSETSHKPAILKDQILVEEPKTLNKRKLFKPKKIVAMTRKRRIPSSQQSASKRNNDEYSPRKRKRIEQLKEDLSCSSSSDSDCPPVKDPRRKVMTKSKSKRSRNQQGAEGNFEFQDMSRDMPLLVPLEIQTECSNSFIPMTPRAKTPSDCSDTDFAYEPGTPEANQNTNLSAPPTPRDDNLTCSPTLLRVDSLMAKDLISKVKITAKKKLFGPTDFSSLEKLVEESPSTTEASTSENTQFDEIPVPEDSFNVTDQLETIIVPRKWKKRTRIEKAQDGLEGMNDPEYRKRQELLLSKHIFADIKKRLLLRRDVYTKIQVLFKEKGNPTELLMELYILLKDEFPEVFGIISCMFSNELIPKEPFEDPVRKAYRDALDMIMAIDAYILRAKYKNGKSSKLLFKLMSSFCSKELTAEEFFEKMKDLFQDAPPLWTFLKQKFSIVDDKKPDKDHVEYIDMTGPSSSKPEVEIVDVSRVLGPVPAKRRNKFHIHNGQLFVNTGSSYVLADVERPKFTAPIGRAPHSKIHMKKPNPPKKLSPVKKPDPVQPKAQLWTKELDLKLLQAYNTIEEDNTLMETLLLQVPFPREKIEERLNFLLSKFDIK